MTCGPKPTDLPAVSGTLNSNGQVNGGRSDRLYEKYGIGGKEGEEPDGGEETSRVDNGDVTAPDQNLANKPLL